MIFQLLTELRCFTTELKESRGSKAIKQGSSDNCMPFYTTNCYDSNEIAEVWHSLSVLKQPR